MKNKHPFLALVFCLIVVSIVPLSAQKQRDSKIEAIVPDFQVNDNGGYSQQQKSSIAAMNNGNYIVVWEDLRNEYDFGFGFSLSIKGDIYAQLFNAEGQSLGNNFKVNDDASQSGQFIPAVATGGNGNFIVTWADGRNYQDGYHYDIYAQRYDQNGLPLDNNFRVNDGGWVVWDNKPGVAADANGNFVIVWAASASEEDTTKIVAQRFSADGTPQGENFIVNNFDQSEDQRTPAVAMAATGDFMVTWVGSYNFDRHPDIMGQRFSADGQAQGGNFIVDDYSIEEVYVIDPKVAVDSDGNFLIAWIDSRVFADIYAQWYQANGSPLGSNFRINEDGWFISPSEETICLYPHSTSGYTVAWYGDGGIYARRFTSDSTALGKSFPISAEFGPNRSAHDPDIAISDNDHFVITWTDHKGYTLYSNGLFSDIYLQRGDEDSTLIGESTKVNDDSAGGLQINPAMAIDKNGNFVIAWEDQRNDEGDIYARRYSADGSRLGEQFRVNDDEIGDKNIHPAVAIDSSGLAMVIWEDYRGLYADIYGQIYSSEGVAMGTNFAVNNPAGSGYFYKPTIASMGNKTFIVTWQISYWDIGAQIYSAESGPVGDSFVVNDVQQDYKLRDNPCVAADDSGHFVIVWQDKRNDTADLYAQRYDDTGLPLGGNFKVNDPGSWGIDPTIAFNNLGSFYIAWTGDGITLQRYSKDGSTVGANIRVSDPFSATAYPMKPDISFDTNNNHIISWELENLVDYESKIYAQRISSSGTAIGESFPIADNASTNQFVPVVRLWNNRIYSTWVDNFWMGSGYDVWANILDFDNPIVDGITSSEQKISTFHLMQNYPNPFNPKTIINYELPITNYVNLSIYNLLGQKVATLIDKKQPAGYYQVEWDASGFSTGVYYYMLTTEKFQKVQKMILIK